MTSERRAMRPVGSLLARLRALADLRRLEGDDDEAELIDEAVQELHNLAFADALVAAERARERKPLDDAQALELTRKHLDRGLSWAPHIVRCTDLELRALIRAVEAAHGIGA